MNRFVVAKEEAARRLDEVAFAHGFALSRSKVQTLIKEGKVLLNGKKAKAHEPLGEGDEVTGEEYVEPSATVQGEDIPLSIVYEDEDLLVLDKPAGLVVHPGNGHHDGTLVNALVYREETLADNGDPKRPGIVHRIDKDTSGLLAVAKTEKAYLGLQKQLSDHSMHREYYALCKGIILEDDGKIDAPIGRDRKHPVKNCVDVNGGKEAVTFFHVEKRFRSSDVTLISCRLLTGRTHQIRVHMDYIGHPLLGDPLYGAGNRTLVKDGQMLHAYRLSFQHPVTGKTMTFECPMPPRMTDFIGQLK